MILFASSRKVGEANKGLGEAPKSCTRKERESATNSIAKRGQGGTSSLFVCPLQGQGTASLVGFGATPQLFLVRPAQREQSTRRRQRSVPASNFARPQTRPPSGSFLNAGDFAPAGATRGLCGRPLDCFAVHTSILGFYRGRGIASAGAMDTKTPGQGRTPYPG